MKVSKRIVAGIAAIAAACVIAVPTIAFAGGGSAAVGTAATEPAVATAGRAAEKASLAQQDATVDVAAYGLDSAAGQGAGFVDADGDGVCDNWNGAGAGAGRGHHGGGYHGRGC